MADRQRLESFSIGDRSDQSAINWHLHQETSFPAGTVTNDDEFAADFSHLDHTKHKSVSAKVGIREAVFKSGTNSNSNGIVCEIAKSCDGEE